MTLGTMKTALKRYGFDDSDPLTDWLNFGMHETVDFFPWSFLYGFSTSITVDTTTGLIEDLPADFGKVSYITDVGNSSNRAKLQEKDPLWFEENVANPLSSASNPEIYVPYTDTQIGVYPIPSGTQSYRMRYIKTVADMDDDADVPGAGTIPTGFHYLIVMRAAVEGLQAENEEDRAVVKFNEWEASLGRKIPKYNKATRDKPNQVRDVMDY